MTVSFTMDRPTTIGAYAMFIMFAWVLFLIHDVRRLPSPPSMLKRLGLICHIIPPAAFFVTSILAQNSADYYLVWLCFLLLFRYWRTVVQIFFWTQYKPALSTGSDTMKASDCTVIVPTVGPTGNTVFDELVASILVNKPACLIFATNTVEAANGIRNFLTSFRPLFENGSTRYQKDRNLQGFNINDFVEIRIEDVGISSKRQQVVAGLKLVKTAIMVSVDDTAIWTPTWLTSTLPAFNDNKVGLVGTRKWVKQLPHYTNPDARYLRNLWTQWCSGLWNTMGGVYLIRHNFEIRSTNAADGGVFCVSGRSSLIRSKIVQNEQFYHDFTNEYALPLGTWFKGFGPLNADDDNFITRYVINKGHDIKVQCSAASTMTTILGSYPVNFKFPNQCTRWSRSTFRQNPPALFADRTIWSKWPLTTWLTYIPWLYNAAALWDLLALYTLTQTNLYATSNRPYTLLLSLATLFQLTKLVKTAEWWIAHPKSFLLYFVIPAYPLLTYCHSALKIWTAVTFWNTEWSGRPNLPAVEKQK